MTIPAATLNLRQLAYFATVADELSFTRAARRLHVAQPWLSSQVRKLEAEMKTSLFNRGTRELSLTPAGEELQLHALRLLREAEHAAHALDRVRDAPSDSLAPIAPAQRAHLKLSISQYALGIPTWIAPLAHFARAGLDAEVQVTSFVGLPDVLDAVRHGLIDVALCIQPFPGDGLLVIPAGREPVRIVLPRHHPLAEQSSVPLRDLAGEWITAYRRQHQPWHFDAVYGMLETAGMRLVDIDTNMKANLSLVESGQALALCPESQVGILPETVIHRALEPPILEMRIAWATSVDCDNPPARRVWQLIREFNGAGPGLPSSLARATPTLFEL
jgi:DNA-binding transcriptional LysR family regulator